MTQILWLLNKWFGIRLAAGVTLSLLLLVPKVALASGNDSDDPPPNTYGRSGGSRVVVLEKQNRQIAYQR
jgi:hypothetical protein